MVIIFNFNIVPTHTRALHKCTEKTITFSGGSSYGRTAPCPIDKNLGLVVAARSNLPQTLGKFFI